MAVIEGPGGPTTAAGAPRTALQDFMEHSPQAAHAVLHELTARLREKDLAVARGWSDGVSTELLD